MNYSLSKSTVEYVQDWPPNFGQTISHFFIQQFFRILNVPENLQDAIDHLIREMFLYTQPAWSSRPRVQTLVSAKL